MPFTTAALLIASVAATVIGAGVGAYGQYQSGQTQSAIAQFNAQNQQINARNQLVSMQAQSQIQAADAQNNFELRSAEAQAQTQNGKAIELQISGQDAVDRQNLIKRQQDYARAQGTQRAVIASSGVSESSGTPLDLLAETAGKIQQDQEEQFYGDTMQRRTLFSEAAQERLGGKFALAGATLDKDSTLAQAGLTNAAATAQYLSGLRGAEITRLTGAASAQAGEYQAGATLFSGIGSAAQIAYKPPTVYKIG